MSEPLGAGRLDTGSSGSGLVRLVASLDGPPAGPVLVLGNSLGTSRALWDAQLPVLARHFRVLRYEHRGHGAPATGYSPGPAGPYTIAELGTDVLALLDELAIERALYCGVSLGGMIGMWLAATVPERIAGLGLCCTSAYLQPADMWLQRAASVRAAGTSSIAGQIVSRWFTPAFSAAAPAVAARFTDGLAAMQSAGYAGCCDAIAAMDLRPLLASISAPALVISGADDEATPPWHGSVIAAGIPDSRLTVIRGAAHLANVSKAAEVTAALVDHFAALQ